jgi:hypothetical protein
MLCALGDASRPRSADCGERFAAKLLPGFEVVLQHADGDTRLLSDIPQAHSLEAHPTDHLSGRLK